MEFWILGPLEVRDADRVIPLGGPKQRAILAILLLQANQVVSRDRLIDELWGGRPPKTAAKTLHGYVSELRQALEPGRPAEAPSRRLLTRTPGYLMDVESDRLDLHRFERLAEDGGRALGDERWESAAEFLAAALALWRGPPLADFRYEPFAQAPIARLEELRMAVLEQRIEVDLALGRHTAVVGELEALVLQHPLREQLRRHLMLALYRSGRHAEALAVYREMRRVLVEELGIDPSHTLQDLERAILRQDPGIDLRAVAGVRRGQSDAEPARLDQPVPERSILVVSQDARSLDALLALAEPLTREPPREVILARLVEYDHELARAVALLQGRRAALLSRRVAARAAAFTSAKPGEDVLKLASEQEVDLILFDAPPDLLQEGTLDDDASLVLANAACDVAILAARDGRIPRIDRDHAVLVPFGGDEHDWAAAEMAAWIADALSVPLRLLGTEADPKAGRRDASRLLARASLIIQRAAGIAVEPLLVAPGDEAIVRAAADGGLLVIGLSSRWRKEGLGAARLAVARRARPPTLFVRQGLRPGALAPPETHTRFTWTLSGTAQKLSRDASLPKHRQRQPRR